MTEWVDHWGAPVRLTTERWEHIVGHPELADLQDAVESTVRKPELVVQSASDPAAHLHYRFLPDTLVGDKWLCVVIKYADADAFVLTAYLTNRPKKGDVLWPSE